MKKIVKTGKAPAAIGAYSQGVIAKRNGLLFTAGQIPLIPDTGEIVEGGIEEQTGQAMRNLREVVRAAGGSMADVVKVTIFLNDMNLFQQVNKVYASFFTESPPARSVIEAAGLPKQVMIEVECIAEIRT